MIQSQNELISINNNTSYKDESEYSKEYKHLSTTSKDMKKHL